MAKNEQQTIPLYGRIKTAGELGRIIRAFRKSQGLTLYTVAGLSHLSMRFLSELERGKETAEIGKALTAMNNLGLEIIIQPRSRRKEHPHDG
ncbi:MAG: transcriptional regulator [Pseudomonadota bacterium]|nr:transcriptional regulator [Pseudomonadota bacterium]